MMTTDTLNPSQIVLSCKNMQFSGTKGLPLSVQICALMANASPGGFWAGFKFWDHNFSFNINNQLIWTGKF